MEVLWDAMTHDEAEPASPTWHEEILASRRAKLEVGTAGFITLDGLKTQKSSNRR